MIGANAARHSRSLQEPRTGFINALQFGRHVPQGLKPAFFQVLNGTAEAVPYPKPIYETSSRTLLAQTSIRPECARAGFAARLNPALARWRGFGQCRVSTNSLF